jgi:hypothetical protein
MLSLEQVRLLLIDRKMGIVSEKSEVSRATIWRIRQGKSCDAQTLEKLSAYFEGSSNAQNQNN